MYNEDMGIVLEEDKKGFTIIEVMLFLALSGFLLAGILAGTGSSISNQRYKDAVQDAVDALRSAYAFVSDTQVELRDKSDGICGRTIESDSNNTEDTNANRGRTTCAVYGAVVMIDGPRIQTTTVIGRDYYDFIRSADDAAVANSSSGSINRRAKPISDDMAADLNKVLYPANDLELLKGLHVNNLAYHCDNSNANCTVEPAGGAKTRKLKWDTSFKAPRSVDERENQDLKLTLLIYRSPVNGAIRTISMNKAIEYQGEVVDYTQTLSNLKLQGIYQYFEDDSAGNPQLTQKDIFLCVDSNGAESYADHRRIIKITKNAHSQSGVVLTNMDEVVLDSNKEEVLCDDMR